MKKILDHAYPVINNDYMIDESGEIKRSAVRTFLLIFRNKKQLRMLRHNHYCYDVLLKKYFSIENMIFPITYNQKEFPVIMIRKDSYDCNK